MKKDKQLHTGFTLIEILVVVSIIGILASIVLVSLNEVRAKSRDAKRISDMNTLITAIELYNAKNKALPGAGNPDQSGVQISPKCVSKLKDDLVNGGFLLQVPRDPIENANCSDIDNNSGGEDDLFFYGWDSKRCPSCLGEYCISINRLETEGAIDNLAQRFPDNDGDPSNGVQFGIGEGQANIGTGDDFNFCFKTIP